MSPIARLAALTLVIVAAGSALGACQAIVGIDDRPYVPADSAAAGAPSEETPPSAECVDYCDTAQSVCQTDLDGSVVPGGILYLTNEACLKTCARIELLDGNESGINCRKQQLNNVATGEDVQRYCANAGPGGNGVCGSNCENYCRLFKSACQDTFEKYAPISAEDDGISVCVSKCQGLTDTGLFSTTQTSGNYFGDTLQCRLVHTCSSLLEPATHCSHAEFKPLDKCLDPPTEKPDCKKFCHLELAECTDYPVYENDAQCEAVCKALDLGEIGDTSQNTVGCRMYHSYNSTLDPKSHCSHTGPGGDGHCGDPDTGNCDSYCRLLKTACTADFNAKFKDESECQADCLTLDGSGFESGFSTSAKGDNLQCRLLNVSRALSNATKYCAAAQGAAPCK